MALGAAVAAANVVFAQGAARQVAAVQPAEVRAWDARIEAMVKEGALALRRADEDPLVPGRRHERLAQVHQGVRVQGGELVRQSDAAGTVSIFGTVYEGIAIDVTPRLRARDALAIVEKRAGVTLGREPELVVLPQGDGFALAWKARAVTAERATLYFVDAHTGAVLKERNDARTQSSVGQGTGVLNDQKKMSVRSASGGYVADDALRPPTLVTFDMRGDVDRTIRFLNGQIALGTADLARDEDNTWTDGAAVDAHAYAGYTYDYFFKRFNRRGLDGNNLRILSLVHPVRRQDIFLYSSNIVGLFYLNAAYFGEGVMMYGEGLPSNLRLTTGQQVNYLAGALDIVAHELSHGVTDYTSQLEYESESGALNESFSDMMAVGTEFFFQEAGSGTLRADYLLGEDVFTPGGIRSLQNPVSFGDPDHYAVRLTFSGACTEANDNCGVHTNSSIPNHAFYLAIEGGRNRVSGLAVAGVGAANREQVERVFFRAFTLMLPPTATFSTARAATLQSARDLYGAGSNAERAVREAWTAVGVS
jgi:thermolysin